MVKKLFSQFCKVEVLLLQSYGTRLKICVMDQPVDTSGCDAERCPINGN